uniref:thymidine kinase n=1 Tax=viral metagenome TaxID=1070528 RepID=A0A6C0IEV1_9ZZZZ
MTTSNESYLELIIGPMFSGKTSRLIDIYKQCKFCNIPCVVINHSSDTRYDDLLLSNHDRVMIPCVQTNNLMATYERLKEAKVYLINEGQFFEDLFIYVVHLLKMGNKVYVCGLDGDFQRKKFGQILDLIPLCDKVTKLTSLCSLCKNGKSGIFSMRLTVETCQTLVGSDNYIPVCRHCYDNNHSNNHNNY